MSELMVTLEEATKQLKSSRRNFISLTAGCDLFMRFVTRSATHDFSDFDALKLYLIERGNEFVRDANNCRTVIAEFGVSFIKDNSIVIVHSYSRVVMLLLRHAAKQHKRFSVYVTESRPKRSGLRAVQELREAGIPATIIMDTAVAYIMDKADMVLVGAEGVVENGGIINQIGSYQVAIVAKAANKPVYAVVESFKFVRLFPLNQYDLPTHTVDTLAFPDPSNIPVDPSKSGDDGMNAYERSNPVVDYTPPSYISLLFTNLGVFTPSGVSDVLIKLHMD